MRQKISKTKIINRMLVLAASLLTIFAGNHSHASLDHCESLFRPRGQTPADGYTLGSFERERREEPTPLLRDDLSYLNELQRSSNLGQLDTRFVEPWDTRIFYSATARKARDGSLPMVNADARASVLFIHGSGTMKATGRNFAKKMNDLTNMGYFTASFDLPFHGHGPTREAFHDVNYFFSWMNRIVESMRVPGKPLFLAGHSFGPSVIAEYARRFPGTVDGVLLISPVAFDPVTIDWYFNRTARMTFDNTNPNSAGGLWADRMMSLFSWNVPDPRGANDISVLNPRMRVLVLTGNREEFVPAPTGGRNGLPVGPNTYSVERAISRLIRGASTETLEGVGHQVMDHKDNAGNDSVLKSILALDGRTPNEMSQLRYENGMRPIDPQDLLAQRYTRDRMFSVWANLRFGPNRIQNLIRTSNEHGAQAILREYDSLLVRRWEHIFENIKATESWANPFYLANRDLIEDLKKPRPRDSTRTILFGRYLELLQRLPREIRERHAVFEE